ncbi:hypothetical protein ACFXDH_19555 [Streptomyces sp. NPDC059467]|uniref:hypothetical protein n=1 Tax=Streptomyces sp. NPDC059467 TaxID=3346844 RepID=UPI0036BF126C
MRFTAFRSAGRARVAAGVGALVAAVLVGLAPLPAQPATAAGTEDSAVTESGAKGPYDDFSRLKVTVHQTKDLRGQGVKVTWTGGGPGNAEGKHANFLQVMQCWGDDAANGPDRTQCEFGTEAGASTYYEALRQVPQILGDPAETLKDPDQFTNAWVPFKPVSGAATTSSTDHTYFGPEDTNSQSFLPDQADGSGETVFEMKSSRESPHLGCGARTTSSGAVEPCWLVVVPRGTHDPDGSSPSDNQLRTSALSRSNWNQRIVFRLDFLPVGDNCAADKAERRVIGSELVTDAITSWQAKLCESGSNRFTFTQSGEDYARSQITDPGTSSPGLAFTVDPVVAPEGAAPVVQAPVALSGLAVGFLWEDPKLGGHMKDMRLNARLLAKMLTESYSRDVRLLTSGQTVPDHLKGNPISIVSDPEFLELNPEFKGAIDADAPFPVMVTTDNSDVNKVVWNYLRSDTDARNFLIGKADPWGMKINPYYKELNLATDTTVSDFPKADPTTTTVTAGTASLDYGVLDLGPYAADMHDAALKTRRGNEGSAYRVGENIPPKLVGDTPIAGQRRAYAITDAASASRYQLDIAALKNADGDYVKPTGTSLLKAAAEMPDSSVKGVKAPAPGKARNGAYPLAIPVYAAASVDQAKDVRQDYARLIRYAAGAGQTQGTARGELPLGYAPLPTAWRTQAEQAAAVLEKGVTGSGDGGGVADSGSGGSSGGGSGGAGSAGGAAGGTGTAGGGAATHGSATAPGSASGGSAGPSAAPGDPAKQNVASSGGLTPAEALGIIRWVLLAVLIVGGAAALSGPVLWRLSARRGATTAGEAR